MSVTEEMIAAYADGELGMAEQAEVEAAIARDPVLGRKLAAHRALREKLAGYYAPIAREPVPAHLASLLATERDGAAAGAAEVVSLDAERQRRRAAPAIRRWAPFVGPALAASLILAFWQPWQARTPEGYADGELARMLDTQLAAAQPGDAQTRILLSFERKGGDLCRAWRGQDSGGIACRDAEGWKIERQFALGSAPTGEFRQAGSEADLLAAAQDMAEGGALDADGERAARESGWKSP